MSNPLLELTFPFPFDKIQPAHFEPAIDAVIAEYQTVIKQVVANNRLDWETCAQPLEEISARFDEIYSLIHHLSSVKNNPEVRAAYEKILPKVTNFGTELMQNSDLYHIYSNLKASEAFAQLSKGQQAIINHQLRDFKLSGVSLSEDKKQQFKKIEEKLSTTTNKFGNNVLDATQNWEMLIPPSEAERLAGMPQHMLTFLAERARAKQQEGWLLGLDMPIFSAVMQYAKDRQLRQTFYEAYVTRASEVGPMAGKYDNTDNIDKIMQLRQQQATLVGYKNYAEYALVSKMAENPQAVVDFLEKLRDQAKPRGQQDIALLHQFAKDVDNLEDFENWDGGYYAERYKQEKLGVSEEKLREYFSESRVLQGMFDLVEKLYGLNIEEVTEFPTWDKTVRLFAVYDKTNHLRGHFYTDLYARDQKRGGAWMSEARGRIRLQAGKLITPSAFLNANFTPASGGKPALLTPYEVLTVFHEFGHTLHHILTQVDFHGAAGINGVAWDAVELPSQFMENWVWEWSVLEGLSEHWQTKDKLPKAEFDKLLATKNFQSGAFIARQLEFALFDFRLHQAREEDKAKSVQQLLEEVRKNTAVVSYPPYNRFQNSFTHIFDGGYSAGYYSYLWAEVLSADAFAMFKEHGGINQDVGQAFLQTVLEKGSSENAMDLFVAFRGRKPDITAFLQQNGILAEAS